jgi:signal transduction histidine kinase/ligand-binding sensor domain-containing protein/CheY-like chemotaxis protein/AraC-like DNA-binding protein
MMKNMKITFNNKSFRDTMNMIFILFGLLLFQSSIPIKYRLTQISSNEGLSQQDVECMTQDKHGFIWVGTYDGLNRYDGNNFDLFRHIPNDPNTISDNRIFCLREWPKRDELWIGTDGGGLNCYNLKTKKINNFFVNKNDKNGLLDNQVLCLDQINNSLWVGTSKGPNRITFSAKNKIRIEQYVFVGTNHKPVSQRTNTISSDNQGDIIAGTDYGLYFKTPNENEFKEITGINANIRQILKDKTGNLWVISSAGVFYYSTLQQKINNYLIAPRVINFTDNPNNLRCILPITDRLLMLTSTNMVYWINIVDNNFKVEKAVFADYSFFENNSLKSCMLDRSMNVWLTSEMDGIAKFDLNTKSINHYSINNVLAKDKIFIQSIIKDYRGRLWIGSNKGVFINDIKKNKTTRLSGVNEKILDILEDKNNNIWITSLNNICFIPAGDETKVISICEQPNLPNNLGILDGPYALALDSKNTVWVGMRTGLLRMKRERNTFKFRFDRIGMFETVRTSNNITKLIFIEKENSLLIGTKNAGLLKAQLSDNGDIKMVRVVSEFQKGNIEHVWSIFCANNGVVYVGTDSGLKKLINNNGKQVLELVSDDYRLRNYKIASIVGDDKQNIWLSTSFGLLCYNTKSKEIKQFFSTDGLSTDILTEGALFDNNGLLYVGSVKGVNLIDISSLSKNNVFPETQFVGLKINNATIKTGEQINGRIILSNSLEFTKTIELKYYENNFTIEFAALHFSNPSKNRFAYKLDGFSDDWTEVSNTIRSATFTNIPPGKYVLKVKSSNCDGVWNETPSDLSIVIIPALWNTIWAYLLYFVIISVIVYFIIKYYQDRQTLKKQLLEEHFEHVKDLEIADVKLKYHTNITHELRTPLTLISAPTEELIEKSYNDEFLNSRLDIIKNNCDRLLQLIGQFLDFRKVINEKYTPFICYDNLHELLTHVKNNFSVSSKLKNIDVEILYDMNIEQCWFDKEIVNKICYNLMSNALKHTPNKGKIFIYASLSQDDTHALISIEDNGIGIAEDEIEKIFERFYQVSGTIGGTGIGLNLCKLLANIHLGDVNVKSVLGEGTIFTLDIPIIRDAYPEEFVHEEELLTKDYFVATKHSTSDFESETKPLILVVEDNFELRDYITSLLSENSKVLVAENGEEGLKLAIGNIPDIIISDIMMPIMNGIELTQKCKNNAITSHIPIILLTAKVSLESQVEGLTYGADDYITKPFNPKILKLKVSNLIKLTRNRTVEVAKNSVTMNERDQKFMASFEQIVLENYSEYDFGIDKICSLMAISRMQLYRKMTAIVNKKPSELIKEIKMKKAYELMKEKGLNITETMNELDYTNYTHFTKLFTEVNGESPRNIMGLKNKN